MAIDHATAVAVAAHQASGRFSEWDAAGELLTAAKGLFEPGEPGGASEGTSEILAGLGRLLRRGPFTAVSLHTYMSGVVPDCLRAHVPTGAPEEDVLRHAIAAATPAGEAPWPSGTADPSQLMLATRVLSGPVQCRLAALQAVAAGYVLRRLSTCGVAQRRDLIRRLIWLMDSRAENPSTLLLGLTGPADPLSPPLRASHRGRSTLTRFPLADWPRAKFVGAEVALGGRITAVRRHRKTTFADLTWDRQSVQLCLDPTHAAHVGLGDLVVVRGRTGSTRAGQPALLDVQLDECQHGSVPDVPPTLRTSLVIGPIRRYLDAAGFVEVLTPVLSDGFGGGAARPFTTWAHASAQTQYLRVTTELALLEAIGSGLRRCYEIGPSFRNEGLRGQAVKEFTMLEAYAVDQTMNELVERTAALIRYLDPTAPALARATFDQAFAQISGIDPADERAVCAAAAERIPAYHSRSPDVDKLARRLWRNELRNQLRGLIAISHIPGPSSPLIAGEGRQAQRTWLYLDGVELAEISQNEVRADVLATRFDRQFADDPHPVHRLYQAALTVFENGVPPVAGVGLGVTRLAQLMHRRGETPSQRGRNRCGAGK